MEFSALHEHLDGGLRAKTIIDIATSKNIEKIGFMKIFQLKKIKYLKNLR